MRQSFRLKTGEISSFFNDRPRPRKLVGDHLVIYYKRNDVDHLKFAVSVGRKFGKAHKRNLIRRRIKAIMALQFKEREAIPLYIVISVMPVDPDKAYDVIRGDLLRMLDQARRDVR